MTPTRCAIGLLTWNGERDVMECVRSIRNQTEPQIEICWIDNASTDATIHAVQCNFPDFASPILMPKNTGFCAGHNLGLQKTNAPYYLALNQDVVLAPDYVEKLCDWMDADPSLAMTSGLILQSKPTDGSAPLVYSAGLVMGRGRFPFELRMGRPARIQEYDKRYVPGVTGAAMMLRREAVMKLAGSSSDVFPPEFFAYFEEVDLALRIARAGLRCGVNGEAVAYHAARGQGGAKHPAIRAHYIKNHWLITLRNNSWKSVMRDMPYIIKGELRHYLPQYLRSPLATIKAFGAKLRLAGGARRKYAGFARRHPGSDRLLEKYYDDSTRLLRERD